MSTTKPSYPIDPRTASITRAARETFDVLVVGGGINGAGIARDAALRGLSVLLLEADDYGFGTTWRSTKLIHGGLRYLEHREWRLVFEGLRERAVLLRTAPHLVRPLSFLVPVFRHGRYSRATIGAGMLVYDALSLGKELPTHHRLSAARLHRLEPALNDADVTGGFSYYDGQVPLPERLCIENVLSACDAGAVALNHMRVTRLITSSGRVEGVVACDAESGGEHEFRAHTVVNATGPWVDAVLTGNGEARRRIGGTKGSHIVVDFGGQGPRHAIYAEAGGDGRPFFIVPWRGLHLIGTTDVPFTGDPGRVAPEEWEIAYLRREVGRVLPGAPLPDSAVLYAFAGVRPLPHVSGRKAGAITRRHSVEWHEDDGRAGLVTVVGGKLTSYRSLARELVDGIAARVGRPGPPAPTDTLPLVPGSPAVAADRLGQHLASVYGPRTEAVLALARLTPELAQPLCPHASDIRAQIVHAARYEGARTVADVLLRRTPAGWSRCRGIDASPAVATILGSELGWSDERIDHEVMAYRAEVDRALVPLGGALVPA